jgi:hypothetical protein
MHIYEARLRKDKRDPDLISRVLAFWSPLLRRDVFCERCSWALPSMIADHRTRLSAFAMALASVIATHNHGGEFKET